HRFGNAQAVNAGQRSDGVAGLVLVVDKDRPDEVRGGEAGFRYQITHPRALAQTARASQRIGTGNRGKRHDLNLSTKRVVFWPAKACLLRFQCSRTLSTLRFGS